MWETKEKFKDRFTKERINYALSVLPWGYKKINNHYRFFIVINAIVGIIPTYVGLYMTMIMKEIVNGAVNHDQQVFFRYMSIYFFLSVFNLFFNTIYGYISFKESSGLTVHMKTSFYQTILDKEYGVIEKYRVGNLLQRIQNDIPNICSLMLSIPRTVITLFVQLIGSAYLIFKNVPEVGLLAIPLTLLFSLGTYFISKFNKKRYDTLWMKGSNTYSILVEHLSNLMIFHTFGREKVSYDQVSDAYNDQRNTEIETSKVNNIFGIISQIINMLISLGAMYYFLNKVLKAETSIGTYTMLMSLVGQLQGQVSSVAQIFPTLFNLMLSSERTNEIEMFPNDLTRTPISEKEALKFYNEKFASISLHNITFSYPGEHRGLVLDDFSEEFKKGEYVAITGHSGCGKSTMQKLMLGLYRPNSGELYLNCKDGTREVLDSAWRSLFSYVPQKNMLFFGTIREAISFGVVQDNQNDDRYWNALKIACADEFVMSLPDGLDTKLGEQGSGFSEGQTQRLAIARAIYSERPILLLDECTSSLDSETEFKLLSNLKSMTNKTVITVTHRPAVLDFCDREIKFKNLD